RMRARGLEIPITGPSDPDPRAPIDELKQLLRDALDSLDHSVSPSLPEIPATAGRGPSRESRSCPTGDLAAPSDQRVPATPASSSPTRSLKRGQRPALQPALGRRRPDGPCR